MHGFIALLRRFRSDERGIFAVIFGVMAIALVALAGAAVDYTSMETARTRAQLALDSAALGLAPKIYDDDITEDELKTEAQAIVVERIGDPQATIEVTDAIIDDDNGTLRFTGKITVPMAFVQLVGIPSLTAGIVSEATKGSINLEVAVALDITKSMDENDRIDDLEEAISGLIDLVVKEDQDPTYSRMALVPYSLGVNVGSLANDVRGTPIQSTNISAASWTTSSKNISAATKANPAVITANTHGFNTDDRVYIAGVSGMTQLNNKIYCVVKVDNNKFQLKSTSNGGATCGSLVNSTNYNTFNTNSTGTAKKCTVSTCKVQVTSANHGIHDGDYVYITDVNGMTQIRNKAWQVESVTQNTFVLKDTALPTSYGTYSNGGKAWCTTAKPGENPCYYRYYKAADNSTFNLRTITTCTTERPVAAYAYTNDPPDTADTKLGPMYPVNSTATYKCPDDQIMPLTDSLEDLHAATADFTTTGSTAGHIGLAWAWYMLSPAFGYLWEDVENQRYAPADPDIEDADPVVKVIVLMTDGDFNTAYYDGVASKDSADIYAGRNYERTNNNARIDISSDQALGLCDEIRDDESVVVYTVAFALSEIENDTERERAAQVMADCATEPAYAYTAENGEELSDAFLEIGKNITDLRLSL